METSTDTYKDPFGEIIKLFVYMHITGNTVYAVEHGGIYSRVSSKDFYRYQYYCINDCKQLIEAA